MHKYVQKRRQRLQKILENKKIYSLLVVNPENIEYLTGIEQVSRYEREFFMVITPQKSHLFVLPLRVGEVKSIDEFYIHEITRGKRLWQWINELKIPQPILFEDDLTYPEYERLSEKLDITYVSESSILADLRMIKDAQERSYIGHVSQITANVWKEIKPQIVEGVSEIEVVEMIRGSFMKYGINHFPNGFAPLVSFGERTASPHGVTGDNKLKKNQVVLVDFGGMYHGYPSDFTRTFFYGQVTKKFSQIEKHVLNAYKLGLKQLKPGMTDVQVDKAVRGYFRKHDLDKYFIHSSGHGLGLEIHESPHLYEGRKDSITLEPGMILTLEPGLYFEGEFGYRYEDTIEITHSGYQVLTKE